jgi:hypothetical protein
MNDTTPNARNATTAATAIRARVLGGAEVARERFVPRHAERDVVAAEGEGRVSRRAVEIERRGAQIALFGGHPAQRRQRERERVDDAVEHRGAPRRRIRHHHELRVAAGREGLGLDRARDDSDPQLGAERLAARRRRLLVRAEEHSRADAAGRTRERDVGGALWGDEEP